jgi:hypothetical protein
MSCGCGRSRQWLPIIGVALAASVSMALAFLRDARSVSVGRAFPSERDAAFAGPVVLVDCAGSEVPFHRGSMLVRLEGVSAGRGEFDHRLELEIVDGRWGIGPSELEWVDSIRSATMLIERVRSAEHGCLALIGPATIELPLFGKRTKIEATLRGDVYIEAFDARTGERLKELRIVSGSASLNGRLVNAVTHPGPEELIEASTFAGGVVPPCVFGAESDPQTTWLSAAGYAWQRIDIDWNVGTKPIRVELEPGGTLVLAGRDRLSLGWRWPYAIYFGPREDYALSLEYQLGTRATFTGVPVGLAIIRPGSQIVCPPDHAREEDVCTSITAGHESVVELLGP